MADAPDMQRSPLAHSPQLVEPALLARITVGRERLLDRLQDLATATVESGSRHYRVLVGPRGSGKSHLLSLLHHRLTEDMPERLAIVRLDEEPWRTPTATHLFRETAMRLLDEDARAPLYALGELPRPEQESAAQRLLIQALDGRALLLLVENLDQVLEQFGDAGQKTLRAFLQNEGCCSMIGTARSLSPVLTDRDKPFHGFFGIDALEPLSTAQVRELCATLAEVGGDPSLLDALRSELGIARIEALDRLLRGNPRRWVMLGEFLDADGLRDPLPAMRRLLDAMLPQLDDRMAAISPQQRLLLAKLGDEPGAATVKTLARSCLVTEQTASSQLRDLRAAGLVTDTKVGRETWYEVADPLLRLALSAGRPEAEELEGSIGLLCHWFEADHQLELREELNTLLHRAPGDWDEAIATLYEREEPCSLAAALLATAGRLDDELLSDAARDSWLTLWRRHLPRHPASALALTALAAAIEWIPEQDPRALLRLPAAIRALPAEVLQ